jgi:ketosteroid isomerase-like protein
VDVQEVSDRLEIRNLIDEYASSLDDGSTDRLVGVFTDDAHFWVTQAGSDESLMSYDGSEEIAQIMTLISPFGHTMHVMLNHQVKVSGDTATSVTYCTANHLLGDPAEANLTMALKYRDEHRRTADGWRIARREVVRYWQEVHRLLDDRVEAALGGALQEEDLKASLRQWAQLALSA